MKIIHQIDLDSVEAGRGGIGADLRLILVEQFTQRLLEILFQVVNVRHGKGRRQESLETLVRLMATVTQKKS